MSTFVVLIQFSTKKSQLEQLDKKRKLIASKLKRRKSNCLFADDIILYTEKTKDCIKNLLEQQFSRVAEYKSTYKKSVVFENTNKQAEKQVNKSTHFRKAMTK